METKAQIQAELNQLAPLLSKLPREHPFLLPENYFNTAAQMILIAVKAERSNEFADDIAGRLHPFEVPDQYFEQLPHTILSNIQAQESKPEAVKSTSMRSIFPERIRWVAAAAVAAIVVTSAILLFQRNDTTFSNQPINYATSVADTSLMLQVADVDESVILELLLDDQPGATVTSNQVTSEPTLLDVADIDDEFFDEI